ncbi:MULTISPECIES: MFS transporter [Streptomyces]|uniref:MFS transporter n=1 Tax=Streptomyces TaxID=1883 RepID=UPI00163B6839|nr:MULTISPECIES: MFS transporter [Streptomyces]MBC2878900.1 MFS transporter [Streptomyces sp. TYQ1024]UBI38912.1 MFS transporter [Streptomyces mobaraensis]UKW31492.1 MFS transporter [Streptomyces sp. TYQ1024]
MPLETSPSPPATSAPAAASRPEPAGASRMTTRAKLVLLVLCAAQFMVALDFSILNVALPVLGDDLGMSRANLQWAVTAFALPSGGFLLLFGRIADLYGRRRLFLAGLTLFTAASVLATFAWDPASFLAGRALQGLGAAVIVPTGMSLLTTTFREGPQRERALGISSTLMSLGFTIGMVLGGVMTDGLGWRSTMGLLGVAGLAVLLLAPGLLTESLPHSLNGMGGTPIPDRPRLDLPGAATVTGGLLALIYALSTAAEGGFGRTDVIAALVAGVVLLAAFAVIESRTAEPLVNLSMLRRPTVAFGNLAGLTTFATMTAAIFLLTLYLQDVLHLSAFRTGLIFGVQGVVAVLAGTVASKVIARFGTRTTLFAGLLGQAACTALLLGIGRSSGAWLTLLAISLGVIGHLWAIVAYGVTATSGLPDGEQGLATGLVTSSQQIGITIGIPLLSALASAYTATLRTDGEDAVGATLGGIRLGLGADAAVVAAVAVLVAVGLRRRGAQGQP